MTAAHALATLAGGVALLLWGVDMIGGAVQRAFGSRLRAALTRGLGNRLSAFGAGVAVTALLQSSTATAYIVASLAAGGLVALSSALAVMLGANVGTTLIVQLVSFDITYVFPLLLLAGVVCWRRGRRTLVRDIGTALVGLGLALLALHLLTETMKPVEDAQPLRDLLHAVTGDVLLNVALAALLSWAAHSSVVGILFVMSLAGAAVISPEAALAMVVGANLGSALNPLMAAWGQEDPVRLRIAAGNMATRLVGCAVALPLLRPAAEFLAQVEPSSARAVADFHVVFNLVLALVFLGPLPRLARLLVRLVPDRVRAADPGTPQYLDDAALLTPSVALSNASREVLRMADVVEAMLRGAQDAFHHEDQDRIAAISRMDDVLDRLFGAIQRYLGAISRESLSDEEAKRMSDTLAFAINLEHVGDIIDKNVMKLARKRIGRQLHLTAEAASGIDGLHARLLDHLQLAVTVYMVGDIQAARRLVEEKEQFRALERATTERHMQHMRSGRPDAIDTSALHLDVIRDLKRIEAHIAATAYSLLEQTGQLHKSRLAVSPGPQNGKKQVQ